jgi:hypothetical protein
MGTLCLELRRSHHEALANYVAAVRPAFDALVSVAAQMSAVLVAVTASSSESGVVGKILLGARTQYDEAVDVFRSTRVLAAGDHFHKHLSHAVTLIGVVLSMAYQGRLKPEIDLDGVISRLRRAWSELNAASNALPGLSVLNIGECCGAHVDRSAISNALENTRSSRK